MEKRYYSNKNNMIREEKIGLDDPGKYQLQTYEDNSPGRATYQRKT